MTPDHTIEIAGIPILIIRKQIKNMTMRIYPSDGRVQISAPLKLDLKTIYQFVESKSEWLHKHRGKLQAMPVLTEPVMESGELHKFLGNSYSLVVVETNQNKQIFLNDQQLFMYVKPGSTIKEKQLFLQQWYKAQMKLLVAEAIKKWQPIIGVTVREWGIKTMKTRWGSCNTHVKRIWLNTTLIKKPILSLECVLVHEMVHLLEASHNKRFYQLMDKFMPDWRFHHNALTSYTF